MSGLPMTAASFGRLYGECCYTVNAVTHLVAPALEQASHQRRHGSLARCPCGRWALTGAWQGHMASLMPMLRHHLHLRCQLCCARRQRQRWHLMWRGQGGREELLSQQMEFLSRSQPRQAGFTGQLTCMHVQLLVDVRMGLMRGAVCTRQPLHVGCQDWHTIPPGHKVVCAHTGWMTTLTQGACRPAPDWLH